MKHHETVGGHVVASVLRAWPGERARQVLERLASEKPLSVELVLVADAHGRLTGAAPLARVVALDGNDPIDKAVERDFPRVRPDTDQEHAASLALHHGVDALPVVDGEGCALGVMPAQALLQVLRQEHVEDLHVLGGIQREASKARHAIDDPPMRRVQHRLPWLVAGLGGSALATAAMAGFEETLERTIAVAFFVPAIVYLADAIGTQTEVIAVRGLSLTRSGIAHLIGGELRTGMLLGAILAIISFPFVLWVFRDARLAGAVATALFVASSIAATIGIAFPWALAKMRRDPAYGSGPLATIVQDVLSLLVYLGVVRAFGL